MVLEIDGGNHRLMRTRFSLICGGNRWESSLVGKVEMVYSQPMLNLDLDIVSVSQWSIKIF